MAVESYANSAQTTLAAAVGTAAQGATGTITVASAASFPTSGQYRISIDQEIMIVTGGQGSTTWTVTRGAEGTIGAIHLNLATVTHTLTAAGLQNLTLGADLAVRSITVSNGPYTPNLPGALTVPTPPGVLASKVWDYGGTAWNAMAFGAKGDKGGANTDDTAAINATIVQAAIKGGVAALVAANYRTTATINLASGVILKGASGFEGVIFGDAILGTIITPDAGAYDAITIPVGGSQSKGAGLCDLSVDGMTDTLHWLIKVQGVTGFVMRNVSVRQAATNANGMLLGSGGPGVFQSVFENLAANCGGGFTGAQGIQIGNFGSNEPANANFFAMLEVQGYVTGINHDFGGGNTFIGTWAQFCTTGIRLNSAIALMLGGWLESLTTGILYTAGSVNNAAIGFRVIGTVTTPQSDLGTGNVFWAMDGRYVGGALAATATITQPSNASKTGVYVGILGALPMISFVTNGINAFQNWVDGAGLMHWGAFGAGDAAQLNASSGSLLLPGRINTGKATPAYSASITPDANLGNWQTITVTNGTAFTVNAPSNPPAASGTQELTIEVLNSSGGVMGAITWNAAFVLVGGAFTNPASTKKRYIRFEWNGVNWIETGRASADY